MADELERGGSGPVRGSSGRGKGSGRVTPGHGRRPPAPSGKGPAPARPEPGGGPAGGRGRAAGERPGERVSPREADVGGPGRKELFLRSSALDVLLVVAVSTSLVYTVSYGFNSADAYRGNLALLVGLIAPLSAVLFAGTWSKRAVPASAIGAVALSLGYALAASALSPEPALFAEVQMGDGTGYEINDVPGNYVIFALVLCATTVTVFLLSRRTVGLVFLLVIGVVSCGIVQFLWREWISELNGIPAFTVAFLGIGMLFVYQSYKHSVYSADRARRTSFLGAFAYSALIGAVCIAMSAAVFACVESVAPGTVDFRPFESHVSPPVDELSNAYEMQDAESDETTDSTSDDEQYTDETAEGGRDSGVGGLGILENSPVRSVAQAMAGYDPDDPDQDYRNIAYQVLALELVIMGLIIILLALAVVAVWRFRRVARLRRIAGRSPTYQVWYIYTFLVERFRRLKLAKPDQLTPLEFAVGFSRPMLPFTRGTGGMDFVDVSSIYQDAVFGGVQPTDEELDQVKGYYESFFKNARRYVGIPKWVLWKFWRI